MTKTMILAVATAIALTACAAPQPPIEIQTPFNAAETAALMQPGTNSITGSALIRQKGGGVVTCAGSQVVLYPATEYAKARQYAIYGGRNFISTYEQRQITPNPPAFSALARPALCNAQGFFRFDNVADGEFILLTRIVWHVGRYNLEEGGFVTARATVRGGQTVEVTLTPQ